MNASWWKGPEYNGIKVILLLVVIAFAGYFVYNGMHDNSLGNTAQLGKNPGGKGRGTGTACPDGAAYSLNVVKVGTSVPTSVTTSVGGVAGGRWLTIRVNNPIDCPVTISKMEFDLTSNYYTLPSPIQNLQLRHLAVGAGPAGIQLDGKKQVAGIPALPDMPIVLVPSSGSSAGKVTFSFSFPGAAAVTVPPFGTAMFRLVSDSQNVDTGSGTKNFKLQMTQMYSIAGGSISDQRVSTGTLPASIITPLINIY